VDVTYQRSDDGRYQYELTCRWADGPLCCWVLLNPSAGERSFQPTRSRCISFARQWGYAGIVQRNLYGYRTTDPRGLLSADDPVGPENWSYLARCGREPLTVAAWGSSPAVRSAVVTLDCELWCIGRNRDGQPRHPLHAPAAVDLHLFLFRNAPQTVGAYGRVGIRAGEPAPRREGPPP
jgi:hypothetical protein